MQVVASGVLVVSKDSFVPKNSQDGEPILSLLLTNGQGQPLKLKCSRTVYDTAVPLKVLYDVEANLDTVGYNIYGDIIALNEV